MTAQIRGSLMAAAPVIVDVASVFLAKGGEKQ